VVNSVNFDLNLVRVFDALMAQRSVSGAAAALNLTQPAVSNALKRLRSLTDDDLFVRTRNGMEPTIYALNAGAALSEGLRLIRGGLERAAPFDPMQTRRRFRLLMTDAGEVVFLPRLMPFLHKEAPCLDLQIMQLPAGRYLEALETDQVDVAIGNLKATAGTLVLRRLFDEHYAIVCRKGHRLHELAQAGELALQHVLDCNHAFVMPPNSVDNAIRALARDRAWEFRIAIEVPHFMVLTGILDQTEMISIVPSLVAAELARRSELVSLPVPFESPSIAIQIGWHVRHQRDAGHQWLRQQIVKLMKG
jgi:DNA-binding transcriptional LysR family regulator